MGERHLIDTVWMDDRVEANRHEHTVVRFSRDYDLLRRLRGHAVDRTGADTIVGQVCTRLSVERPAVSFHGGRGPYTGYCLAPRWHALEVSGSPAVVRWEQAKRRPWPEQGMIRLGALTSVGTVAHELGHHLVHLREPLGTPSHGKVWVRRFDEAATTVSALIALE